MTTVLTEQASPESVLAVARILARTRAAWGSLEFDDYVGAACLAFYMRRSNVAATARNFHNLMVRCMTNAMRDQLRKECREYGLDRPRRDPLVVQDRAPQPSEQFAGRGSASPITEHARHRRLAARREHNRTYYYRHVSLQACEICGTIVNRGHGARRCDAHMTETAKQSRRNRERRMARLQQLTQEGAKVA